MSLFYTNPDDPSEVAPPTFKQVYGFSQNYDYELEIEKLKIEKEKRDKLTNFLMMGFLLTIPIGWVLSFLYPNTSYIYTYVIVAYLILGLLTYFLNISNKGEEIDMKIIRLEFELNNKKKYSQLKK